MSSPQRIQRKRSKGWKMPPNTIYVGRPSKWGNPWTLQTMAEAGYSVEQKESALKICTDAYQAWLEDKKHWAHGSSLPSIPDLSELRGKNLACWCKPSDPYRHTCHADVLLELANREGSL